MQLTMGICSEGFRQKYILEDYDNSRSDYFKIASDAGFDSPMKMREVLGQKFGALFDGSCIYFGTKENCQAAIDFVTKRIVMNKLTAEVG
jgi:hypothetical protein